MRTLKITWFSKFVLLLILAELASRIAFAQNIKGSGNIGFDANADGADEAIMTSTGLGIGTTSPSTNLQVTGGNLFISGKMGLGFASASANLELGTLGLNAQTITSAATASGNSVILVDTSSANITVTLPTASTCTGRIYHIKKISSSYVVTLTSASNLDSKTNYSLRTSATGYPFASFVSDGSMWYIFEEEGLTSP